MASGPEPGVQR
jgi:hypothetical protein